MEITLLQSVNKIVQYSENKNTQNLAILAPTFLFLQPIISGNQCDVCKREGCKDGLL